MNGRPRVRRGSTSAIRIRLLIRPLRSRSRSPGSPPTSRVFATCVPPSAWRSSPTISIVRISVDPRRQQVDLRPDEVRDRRRPRRAAGRRPGRRGRARQLGVDGRLDRVDEVAAHRLELEVHPPGAGLHVAAGDERAVVAPDDAAQRVEGRVGAHQARSGEPSRGRPGRRSPTAGGSTPALELVDDLVVRLARRHDDPGPAVGGPQEDAAIGRLAAAARDRRRSGRGRRAAPSASSAAPVDLADRASTVGRRRPCSRGSRSPTVPVGPRNAVAAPVQDLRVRC